jgi:hypothetical protein
MGIGKKAEDEDEETAATIDLNRGRVTWESSRLRLFSRKHLRRGIFLPGL